MSKIPTEIMPESENSSQTLPKAEPVGNFAALKTAKPAPATPIKTARKSKRSFSFLLFFVAGLSGAAIALLGGQALRKTAMHLPAADPIPPAPPIFAVQTEKRVLEAQIKALFAQKSRQLNEQTAESAQILQELADKAVLQAEGQMQSDDRMQTALNAIDALSRKLDGQIQAQAAGDRSLATLKKAVAVTENRNREILFKTNTLREEMAILYDKRQKAEHEVARLLALQNLQAAFNSGAPYAAELRIFNAAFPHALASMPVTAEQQQEKQEREPLSGQKPQYPATAVINEALTHYQDSGLPNKAALAHDFTLLIDRLTVQGLTVQEGGSFWQKLQNSLAQWIIIRPQGAVKGTSPAALLARMEKALAAGDYKIALAEAVKLPPQVQAEIQIYTDIIRLRLNADIFFRQTVRAVFPPDETAQRADKTIDETVIILPDKQKAAPLYAP